MKNKGELKFVSTCEHLLLYLHIIILMYMFLGTIYVIAQHSDYIACCVTEKNHLPPCAMDAWDYRCNRCLKVSYFLGQVLGMV